MNNLFKTCKLLVVGGVLFLCVYQNLWVIGQTKMFVLTRFVMGTTANNHLEFNNNNNNTSEHSKPWHEAGGRKMIQPRETNETLSSTNFVNQIMTTRDPLDPSCHRTCVDFRNQIYLPTSAGIAGAGLIDRLTIFGTVLNMAGFLCARLYVPRPRFLLNPSHNAKQPLDVHMSWSEFGDFVFWNDPMQQRALIDWDNTTNFDHIPVVDSLFNTTNELFKITYDNEELTRHFREMETFVFEQQRRLTTMTTTTSNNQTGTGFVWAIGAPYFRWCDLMSRELEQGPLPQHYKDETERRHQPVIFADSKFYQGCQYADVSLPRFLREWQDTIVGQILSHPPPSSPSIPSDATTRSSPLVGYFHLRRGDTIRDCNTKLPRMAKYLNCSLGDLVARLSELSSPRRDITVLLSSDEANPKYRRHIMHLIEQQHLRSPETNRINVTAIDLDHLVERTIRDAIEAGTSPAWRLNNFHIFQLIFSIGYNQTLVQFHMEQRRRGCCRECDNVTEELLYSGAFYS